VGFARIKFGNYFQVASWQKSSSGEISLNIQLGAACAVSDDLLADPRGWSSISTARCSRTRRA